MIWTLRTVSLSCHWGVLHGAGAILFCLAQSTADSMHSWLQFESGVAGWDLFNALGWHFSLGSLPWWFLRIFFAAACVARVSMFLSPPIWHTMCGCFVWSVRFVFSLGSFHLFELYIWSVHCVDVVALLWFIRGATHWAFSQWDSSLNNKMHLAFMWCFHILDPLVNRFRAENKQEAALT